MSHTSLVQRSFVPLWLGGQSFLLPIPHPREACAGEGGVELEVYHGDFGEPSEFLGQARNVALVFRCFDLLPSVVL